MRNEIKVIGFDADDTLWVNENYYRETERRYTELMSAYSDSKFVMDTLFKTEMKNLEMFGYGIKPFIISMIENAIQISDGKVTADIIESIIGMGREMFQHPVELLPGVKEVLNELHGRFKLIVATKGDLLDQERKLKNSSLSAFFHHIEVMSDKTTESYRNLLGHLEIQPAEFVMIGNSLRSDILPPYGLGCYTIHVPYEMTWQHEMDVEGIPEDERFHTVETLQDILKFLL